MEQNINEQKEKKIKAEKAQDERRDAFLEKYPVGNRCYDKDNNILIIEEYISAPKLKNDRIEISCGRNGFASETKEVSRKEFFEMMENYNREGVAPVVETEVTAKKDFEAEFGGDEWTKERMDDEGSVLFIRNYANGKVNVRVKYFGQKRFSLLSVSVEEFKKIVVEMKKTSGTEGKRTLKEMLGFREERVEKPAIASSGIAPEKPEQEAETEQEFTKDEKEILEIYLEDAKEIVSFISKLDYKGEYGYRKERVVALREAELERFWDKFERGISEEGEFAGEKLKKAMEYWKKMSAEK